MCPVAKWLNRRFLASFSKIILPSFLHISSIFPKVPPFLLSRFCPWDHLALPGGGARWHLRPRGGSDAGGAPTDGWAAGLHAAGHGGGLCLPGAGDEELGMLGHRGMAALFRRFFCMNYSVRDFSPHFCVGFLMVLVFFGSVSRPLLLHPPPPLSFTHNFVTHNLSHLSHTTLSHTIFDTHTHNPWHTTLSHTIFDTYNHNLSDTTRHLLTSTFVLRGRRYTSGTGLDPVARLGPAGRRWRRGTLRGRRGTWRPPRSICVAGVGLGDIHILFAWQAWHLFHWDFTGLYSENLHAISRICSICLVLNYYRCDTGNGDVAAVGWNQSISAISGGDRFYRQHRLPSSKLYRRGQILGLEA